MKMKTEKMKDSVDPVVQAEAQLWKRAQVETEISIQAGFTSFTTTQVLGKDKWHLVHEELGAGVEYLQRKPDGEDMSTRCMHKMGTLD